MNKFTHYIDDYYGLTESLHLPFVVIRQILLNKFLSKLTNGTVFSTKELKDTINKYGQKISNMKSDDIKQLNKDVSKILTDLKDGDKIVVLQGGKFEVKNKIAPENVSHEAKTLRLKTDADRFLDKYLSTLEKDDTFVKDDVVNYVEKNMQYDDDDFVEIVYLLGVSLDENVKANKLSLEGETYTLSDAGKENSSEHNEKILKLLQDEFFRYRQKGDFFTKKEILDECEREIDKLRMSIKEFETELEQILMKLEKEKKIQLIDKMRGKYQISESFDLHSFVNIWTKGFGIRLNKKFVDDTRDKIVSGIKGRRTPQP